jgi:hypothetical protein
MAADGEVRMTRLFSISVLSAALALGLTSAASAQTVNRLTTKSYQPIGKQKLQVDLTQVDAGELYRDLRDHLKTVLEQRGNPVGSSGSLGIKIEVVYSRPIEPPPIAPDRPLPSERQTPGLGQSSPIPQDRTIGPERRTPLPQGATTQSERLNPLRINLVVYRETLGAVVWTAESSCAVAFVNAKEIGRRMIDQMVARLDSSVSLAAECGS